MDKRKKKKKKKGKKTKKILIRFKRNEDQKRYDDVICLQYLKAVT